VCEVVFGSRRRQVAALICVLLTGAFAQAKIHRSQGWAENQFDKAESQREALIAQSEQSRTRQQYESVIATYRRIVLEAPTSSKADGSAFEVAELTAEMARRFKDDATLFSAVREYKFLRREYPSSKHRIEALLAIGVIYKNDLGDVADGQSALEDLVRQYPNSQSAQKAGEQGARAAGPQAAGVPIAPLHRGGRANPRRKIFSGAHPGRADARAADPGLR